MKSKNTGFEPRGRKPGRSAALPLAILVDMDNIAYKDNVYDSVCLADRIKCILRAFSADRSRNTSFHFFCNEATHAFLKKNGFPFMQMLQVSGNYKDAADHMLLNHYRSLLASSIETVVVTSDKTLARLVHYFYFQRKLLSAQKEKKGSEQRHNRARAKLSDKEDGPGKCSGVSFGTFKQGACSPLHVHDCGRFALAFNDSADLDAFIASLALYRQRFP